MKQNVDKYVDKCSKCGKLRRNFATDGLQVVDALLRQRVLGHDLPAIETKLL